MVEISQYTYASLVDEAMNREKHSVCNKEDSRENDFDFTQTNSMEEAYKFAVEGWDLGLEQYKIEDGVLVGGTTELHPSLAGCLPHVQNYIMGFPQEMYNLYDSREYNLPTMDIVVNLTYPAYIDSSNALEFGKSLVSYINAMASSYNIRVTGVFVSKQSSVGKDIYEFITLKDFDSALVINNIAFAFHPSFFRRIWFSIAEGKDYWSYGYGRSISNYDKVAKEHIGGAKSDKTHYFKTLANIDGKYKWEPKDIEKITF